MSKTLSISLMIVTFILGISFGYVFSPQYTMDANASKEMPGLGQADRYLDLRYINQMIAHHRGAILLAEQVLEKSKRPEIQGLAKEILEINLTQYNGYFIKRDNYFLGKLIRGCGWGNDIQLRLFKKSSPSSGSATLNKRS